MQRFVRFFVYNNIVPITLIVVILGTGTAYAATNPDVVVQKHDQVVSIDNTYIANVDLAKYSPSVKILSVTQDADAYYVQYVFSTIALVDSVWQNSTTTQTMKVTKQSLGGYRDLGLFVTQQLRQLIQAEMTRLKKTQVIERKQVTQKTVVTKYSGIVGGFLSDKTTTIAGYKPVVKPPQPQQVAQTFARPDPNAKPPVVQPQKPVVPVQPASTTQTDVTKTDDTTTKTEDTTTTGNSTKVNGTSQDNSSSDTTNDDGNQPPTLSVLGDNPVMLFVGETYTDLGAVVTDDHDTDLSVQVSVNGKAVDTVTLNTATSTTYTITYASTDSEGATSQAERIVYIQNKQTTNATGTSDTTTPTTSEDQGGNATTTTVHASTTATTTIENTTQDTTSSDIASSSDAAPGASKKQTTAPVATTTVPTQEQTSQDDVPQSTSSVQ